MCKVIRKGAGQPLRDAMEVAGLSGPALAEATKKADPTGKGVSSSAIGNLAGQGKTSQEECRLRTAYLIAAAIPSPFQDLFELPPTATATVIERSHTDGEHRHSAGHGTSCRPDTAA